MENEKLETSTDRSIALQLVHSTIDLVWAFLNLADEMKAQNRLSGTADALERARTTLLKAKGQATELTSGEFAAVAPTLELLDDVLKSIEATT